MSEQNSTGETIAKFEKNSKEEVRVTVSDYHGRQLMNIRIYYRNDAGEWLPSNKGIALSIDRYRDLADAIVQLGEWLQKNKLLT